MNMRYFISGMHCTSCSFLIEGELEDLGVDSAKANYAKQMVDVAFDPERIKPDSVVAAITKLGYRVVKSEPAG